MRVTNVETAEDKNGNPYKKAELSNGATISVFSRNSRYSEIEEGLKLTDDDFHQNGKWTNLIDPENPPKDRKEPKWNTGNDKDALQDRTEYSIKLTTTFKMAHEAVMTRLEADCYDKPSNENLRKEIGRWRNWYWKEWENIKGEEPITPEDVPF